MPNIIASMITRKLKDDANVLRLNTFKRCAKSIMPDLILSNGWPVFPLEALSEIVIGTCPVYTSRTWQTVDLILKMTRPTVSQNCIHAAEIQAIHAVLIARVAGKNGKSMLEM